MPTLNGPRDKEGRIVRALLDDPEAVLLVLKTDFHKQKWGHPRIKYLDADRNRGRAPEIGQKKVAGVFVFTTAHHKHTESIKNRLPNVPAIRGGYADLRRILDRYDAACTVKPEKETAMGAIMPAEEPIRAAAPPEDASGFPPAPPILKRFGKGELKKFIQDRIIEADKDRRDSEVVKDLMAAIEQEGYTAKRATVTSAYVRISRSKKGEQKKFLPKQLEPYIRKAVGESRLSLDLTRPPTEKTIETVMKLTARDGYYVRKDSVVRALRRMAGVQPKRRQSKEAASATATPATGASLEDLAEHIKGVIHNLSALHDVIGLVEENTRLKTENEELRKKLNQLRELLGK